MLARRRAAEARPPPVVKEKAPRPPKQPREPPVRMTQEQRLEEAKVTEQENLASLNEFLARELDKKRTTRKATQLYAPDGPP